MNRQAEMIKKMSDRDILINVYLTQGLVLLTACILGYFLFSDWQAFRSLFEWNVRDVVIYGVGFATVVLILEGMAFFLLPKAWMDDGGINDRVFANRSILHIAFLSLVVAVCEEILFRGVLQTHFGIIFASALFAIVHIRYLYQPFLFTVTVMLSFSLGLIYEWTGSLVVTITAHFLIDFVLGTAIAIKARRKKEEDAYGGEKGG